MIWPLSTSPVLTSPFPLSLSPSPANFHKIIEQTTGCCLSVFVKLLYKLSISNPFPECPHTSLFILTLQDSKQTSPPQRCPLTPGNQLSGVSESPWSYTITAFSNINLQIAMLAWVSSPLDYILWRQKLCLVLSIDYKTGIAITFARQHYSL